MVLSEKCLKIFKTCNLYLTFLTMGMYVTAVGPCLLDLKDLVNTDMQHIGIIFTARSIGLVVGSLLSGIMLDGTRYKQAVLTVCNILLSSAILLIPWSINLGMLAGCMFVCSSTGGILFIGGNVLCLKLWGRDSGPYIHALYFLSGMGALVGPLITAPFLGTRPSATFSDVINNVTYATNFSSTYNYTYAITDINNITTMQNTSKIVYPFSIIGLFGMLVSIMFLLISIISPTEVELQHVKTDQNSKQQLRFIFTILVLNFLFRFVSCGIDVGYTQMLTTYLVNGYLKLLASTGSYMTSVFWIAVTVSRLAVVFMAIKLSHFTIVVISLIVISVGGFILVFLAYYEWALWVTSILLGAGVGPCFGAAVAWMNMYIIVTNRMMSVLGIAVAVANMVMPFTISCFIETFPDIFIYVIFSSCISCCPIILLLFLIVRKRQKKCEIPNVELS